MGHIITVRQLNETFRKNWSDLRLPYGYSHIEQIRAWFFSSREGSGIPGGWMVLGKMAGRYGLFFVDAQWYQHSFLSLDATEEATATHHANRIAYILAGDMQPTGRVEEEHSDG
jgi:hypothetical protein